MRTEIHDKFAQIRERSILPQHYSVYNPEFDGMSILVDLNSKVAPNFTQLPFSQLIRRQLFYRQG